MTEHRARVDELLADYRRSREHLAGVQRELAAVRASASSGDGLVKATVGAHGALTGLEIGAAAYREYGPAELAREIVRLVDTAGMKAFTSAEEVLAPALPQGTDPNALLRGTADLDAVELVPDLPRVKEPVEDESFEDQVWLDDEGWPTAGSAGR
ncbi:YbaB/EbfC family nucleoid-associated protein [Amycolatopsis magusensis]|uniref:DNA-binding protein YbaB n=1 Tax=Amycolatopsis magusensis TaxID=882444 RepID=A0ABS4PMR4_9PSEU|nr:YbaB/EbfC family nucleoid-associated protein [Amycolatopsis magusensis]MBP2180720.1 DNA-binding protein YbaB [Amycolatopsis magusensis]MDI5980173.1 YbaB/EbfC family nucleoid-associated protein [Amycolatopsis magusensis]